MLLWWIFSRHWNYNWIRRQLQNHNDCAVAAFFFFALGLPCSRIKTALRNRDAPRTLKKFFQKLLRPKHRPRFQKEAKNAPSSNRMRKSTVTPIWNVHPLPQTLFCFWIVRRDKLYDVPRLERKKIADSIKRRPRHHLTASYLLEHRFTHYFVFSDSAGVVTGFFERSDDIYFVLYWHLKKRLLSIVLIIAQVYTYFKCQIYTNFKCNLCTICELIYTRKRCKI